MEFEKEIIETVKENFKVIEKELKRISIEDLKDLTTSSNIDDVMENVSKIMIDALSKVKELREKQIDCSKYIQENGGKLTREQEEKKQEIVKSSTVEIVVIIDFVAFVCDKLAKKGYKFKEEHCLKMFT